jgi:hypothetical protein
MKSSMTFMSSKWLVTYRDHIGKISRFSVPRDWFSGVTIDHVDITRPYHGTEGLQIATDKVVGEAQAKSPLSINNESLAAGRGLREPHSKQSVESSARIG